VAAGDLTTLASVREFLRITDAAQTSSDTLLSSFITQASRAIRTHCGQEFAPENTGSLTRSFAYYGGGRLFVAPYTLRSVTSVQIDTDTDSPTTLTEDSDFFVFPRGGGYDGVYEHLELRGFEPARRMSSNAIRPWREVSITGTWGFDEVPGDVGVAANMLVAWWMRQHSSVPGNMLEGEGDRYGPVAWPSGVLSLLAPYRVVGFGYGG